MSRQFYNLPSLNALATFEAVARHQSLTLAAGELGVTPGAVSRQIKILESEVGIELLIREHKKIYCNKNGKALYDSLRLSFSNLNKTISEFSNRADDLTFSLGSTIAFSSLWLMPRLSQFWKKHPQVRINHILSDTVDSSNEAVDISIRYSLDASTHPHATLLFNDQIYPVCSPKLAEKYEDYDKPEKLTHLPLLQLHHDDKSWTDWRQWFRHYKVTSPLNNVSSFNNYIIALQAAQDNLGVLLGWDKLVRPLISQNKLVRLLDITFNSPGGYFLSQPTNKKPNTGAKLFIDWVTKQKNND